MTNDTGNDTERMLAFIQAQGERITLPRRLVIEALGQTHQHLTVAEIQQRVLAAQQRQPLSETTVYRVLQWLKDLGLVSQTDMGQSGIVYARLTPPYHHHLICLTCGAITTLPDALFAPLREQLDTAYGFEARIEHMAIYGQCETCRQSVPSE